MAMFPISWKSLTMICLIVLASSGVNGTSVTSERRDRYATTNRQRPLDHSSPNALMYEDEESSSTKGIKVSHRLVGGHVRLETSTTSLKTESDEATWDDGLILSSAGNGKEKSTTRSDDDDAEKTLSQQIKEGKYGLIQNELYPSRPERPGIISYSSNPDVPKDNAKNLGGLDEDEIWLAENHVLVLRGGNFPDHEKDRGVNSPATTNDWSPIDDYKAPKRQVKIPPNPKVPPPFPVQLTENGPIRLIGVNGSSEESSNDKDFTRDKGFLPGQGPFFAFTKNGTFHTQDLTSQENTMKKTIGDEHERKSKSSDVPPPRDVGVIGPFLSSLPPSAVFVMPPSNQSDYDDDDQSIYYPPPYSFYYKQDNSTPVPPGPLVPGIILPPPPDFFSSLEEKTTVKNRPSKYPKRPGSTVAPRLTPTYYPARKSSPKPFKIVSTSGSSPSKATAAKYTSRSGSFTMKPVSDIKYKTTTARSSEKIARARPKSNLIEATPTIEPTTEIPKYQKTRPFGDSVKTTSKNRWPSVSSNPVPLVTYYSSSTPSIVHQSVEVTPASVNVITEENQRGSTHQASYYFYEEANEEVNHVTTPSPLVYHRTTTEAPYYSLRDIAAQAKPQEPEKSYYETPIVSTQRTPKHFRLESLKPVQKTSLRYRLDNSAPATNSVTSSGAKSHQREPLSYYTTSKPPSFSAEPENDYDTKPKPIYQYSYESADYSKRREHDYYEPENQRPYNEETRDNVTPEPFDEWQDVRDVPQYDYEGGETLPEQDIQPERENDERYRNRLSSYRTTTARPTIVTTVNPRQSYYTRQDDQLLDDVTREYFTNFGKKLRGESLPSTTPIYADTRHVKERPEFTEVQSYVSNDYERVEEIYQPPRVKVHYGDQAQRPYSLEDDTRVNYKDPLPPSNPQSEWIPGFNPGQSVNAPLVTYRQHHTEIDNYDRRNLPVERLTSVDGTNNQPTNFIPLGTRDEDRDSYGTTRPVSLDGDVAVNYRDPRPPINPDAEYVDPTVLRNNNNANKASYFAYRLPGDGGHFYFLTPQAISQRQDHNDGYLYSRPRTTRFSRQRRPRNS